MKKLLMLAAIAIVAFGACKEEDKEPILKAGNAPAWVAPNAGGAIVITPDNANNTFADFKWSAADFGFPAGIAYSVEMDLAGNNFANPTNLGTVNATELKGITNGRINEVLNIKGRPFGEASQVEFRIAARVSSETEVPVLVSEKRTLSVTPYEIVIVYPQLQVPGSYQLPSPWTPANNSTVIFSAQSNKKYEGFIYFGNPDTKFKFTDGPTWDTNYGDTGADGTLERNGDDIVAAGGVGLYRLKVDLNESKYEQTQTNWGIIGNATGSWDVDKDLTYDPVTNKLSITLDLVAGEIKFRANDDWAINFGDDGDNRSMEYNGANIKITQPGNYTVELSLDRAVYRYKLTKN
jgi:starch-binding outer membrane protein SusE/F